MQGGDSLKGKVVRNSSMELKVPYWVKMSEMNNIRRENHKPNALRFLVGGGVKYLIYGLTQDSSNPHLSC